MPGPYSIFASVGNATQPFDRFVRMVDEAAGETGLAALIQTGASTYVPRHASAVDFVTREAFEDLLRSADRVITHAGVGSVMSAVRAGKAPIVVARCKDHDEVINDHQHELARELSELGWVRVVATTAELVQCLLDPLPPPPAGGNVSNQRMRDLVVDFIR